MKTQTKPNRPKIVVERSATAVEDVHYATHDLYFAAYLSTLGVYLVDVLSESGRVAFVFDDRAACVEASRRWNNEDDEPVQASVFGAELKKLKGLAIRGGF